MTIRTHTILWAMAIIATALLLSNLALSNAANFGIIMGLIGAAIGSVSGHWSKRKAGC